MARVARKRSKSGIYHIMLRGVNKKQIFHDDDDHLRFLEIVEETKEKANLKVYGWCLMGNHVHLLLCEGNEDISNSMKRMGVSYAFHYQTKYKWVGHLFQGRFRSEPVDKEDYLLTVIRYIHQNPVKARLVNSPEQWRWSSCIGYYGRSKKSDDILDKEFILGLFSNNQIEAIGYFKLFNEIECDDHCLDDTVEDVERMTDEEAREAILKCLDGIEIEEIKNMKRIYKNAILREIKSIKGIRMSQVAKILDISPNIIYKI